MPTYATSLLGGALIGLSSVISGLLAGIFRAPSQRWLSNACFICGLALGPALFKAAFGGWPVTRASGSLVLFAVAGLLVGFGTRLGSGCTSGHGVCGLARLSPRSVTAVATFLVAGIVTVALMRAVDP